jgi:hypothetical protein
MSKTYGDIKPGDTVKGGGGEVLVASIEDQPNGLRVFYGHRPDTGKPGSTWGWSDAEVTR